MVINGGWTIGVFSAYITIFIAMAAKLFNSTQKSQVSWERIKPYFTERQSENTESHTTLNGGLEMSVENLSFCYGKDKDPIIKNISFKGRRGEIIGITGPVASGKSSLAAALLGLYPYIGSIRINGKELRDFSEHERSLMIVYSGHDPQLLSDTIYNNITLGNGEDVSAILSDVCFNSDLEQMPDETGTLVGNNGIRLSGGQQARALFHKSKIIILDDPFSAVDMKTEEKIVENIRRNYKDSLIILVSHRLAIFDRVDRIILLGNGKTVQYGSHSELMMTSEVYRTIYTLQGTKAGDYDEE